MRTVGAETKYCRQCDREMHDTGGYADKSLCWNCQPNKYGKRKCKPKAELAAPGAVGEAPGSNDQEYRFVIVARQTDSGHGGGAKTWAAASIWSRKAAQELLDMAVATMRRIGRPVELAIKKQRIAD